MTCTHTLGTNLWCWWELTASLFVFTHPDLRVHVLGDMNLLPSCRLFEQVKDYFTGPKFSQNTVKLIVHVSCGSLSKQPTWSLNELPLLNSPQHSKIPQKDVQIIQASNTLLKSFLSQKFWSYPSSYSGRSFWKYNVHKGKTSMHILNFPFHPPKINVNLHHLSKRGQTLNIHSSDAIVKTMQNM